MDKVVHLLVYYIFAVLGYRALANKAYYLYAVSYTHLTLPTSDLV